MKNKLHTKSHPSASKAQSWHWTFPNAITSFRLVVWSWNISRQSFPKNLLDHKAFAVNHKIELTIWQNRSVGTRWTWRSILERLHPPTSASCRPKVPRRKARYPPSERPRPWPFWHRPESVQDTYCSEARETKGLVRKCGTYVSVSVGKCDSEVGHSSQNGDQGLNGVAVNHRSVLFEVFGCETTLVDDSANGSNKSNVCYSMRGRLVGSLINSNSLHLLDDGTFARLSRSWNKDEVPVLQSGLTSAHSNYNRAVYISMLSCRISCKWVLRNAILYISIYWYTILAKGMSFLHYWWKAMNLWVNCST